MSIQVIGSGGVVADVDGTTYRAMKTTLRPVDYGLGGSYQVAAVCAAVTPYNGSVFQFHWPSSNQMCAVWFVGIGGLISFNTTVAGLCNLQLFVARQYTALGAGGNQYNIQGAETNGGKIRTSMTRSRVDDFRGGSGAVLTNGTWILDSNPIGQLAFSVGTTNLSLYPRLTSLYGNLESDGEPMPLILRWDEGLNLNAFLPASGGGFYIFEMNMSWSEIASY